MLVPEMLDNYHFSERLGKMKIQAENDRKVFLRTDLNILQEEKGFAKTLEFLIKTYQSLALFPDTQIRAVFQSIGFKSHELLWMLEWTKIEAELNTILKNGDIKVHKQALLIFLKSHLDFKIIVEVSKHFNLVTSYDGKPITMPNHTLIKIFKKRAYEGGEPKTYTNKIDININESITRLESQTINPKHIKKDILQLSNGKTKILLQKIGNCFEQDEEVKEMEFYNRLYDFFKLINPDEPSLLTEDEFNDRPVNSYRSYRIYRHKRLKDILL